MIFFQGNNCDPAFSVEKIARVMINKEQLLMNLKLTNYDNVYSYLKNCDTTLYVILFIETPVRVLNMLNLGNFAARTSQSMITIQTLEISLLWFETPGKFNCQTEIFSWK